MSGPQSMTGSLNVRESIADDTAMIEALYPAAFPDEDLLPLVQDLLQAAPWALSLVGMAGASLVGHIVFTRCGVIEGDDRAALLGPLAVAPAHQRQGIGSSLVRVGLQRLRSAGVAQVCVLGDPAYYSRFGFIPETHVLPPYPLPDAWQGAWQSTSLMDAEPPLQGKLHVPEPWQHQSLWIE